MNYANIILKMKRFFISYLSLFITSHLFIEHVVVSALENGSCEIKKCSGSVASRSYPTAYTRTSCYCDADCSRYNDCCVDSPNKKPARIFSSGSNLYDCVAIQGRPYTVYMRRSCRKTMSRGNKNCSLSQNLDEQTANYTLKLPVTTSDGITYGNQFCASCNRALNYSTWKIRFSCNSNTYTKTLNTRSSDFNSTMSKFKFNETLKLWTYDRDNQTDTCTFYPVPDRSFRKSLRICVPNLVTNCSTGTSLEYQKQCANYTSFVQNINTGIFYKNEYCALCNNVSTQELDCTRTINQTTTITPTTYTSASMSRWSTRTFKYSSSTSSTTSIPTTKASKTKDTAVTTQVREFLQIIVKQKCSDIVDSLLLMKLTVETKSFPTVKRTRLKESNLISAYPVRICKTSSSQESEETSEESYVLKYIVNLGVIISIFFTSSHLYDFVFSNFSSTKTQRTLASYAVTLIISNFGFLASNVAMSFCSQFGSITYFGFLTSFFWLSALSFDVSCKIWCCIQDTDIIDKNLSPKKFTIYSLVSCIFPLIIIFAMTYVAERDGDFILESRVYETCWFQNDKTLSIFFLFPLTIAMSVNGAFYLFSAHVVRVQRSSVAKLFAKYGIDFKFHTGLIIASNLMWLAALIAFYYENSFLWLCFACLNAISGLLVYICSPVKHAFSNRITAYFNNRFLPVDEVQIQK